MAQTVPKTTNSLINAPTLPLKRQRRLPIKPLLFVAVVAVAGTSYLVQHLQSQPRTDVIRVNGRIEGYETEIGVKRSGRIEWIEVREGSAVKKGQRLIKLDDSNDQLLQQQLSAAEAQLASMQSDAQQTLSDVERVKSEIEQVNSEIREAQLNLQQSRGDTQGRIDQARSNVAAAKAQLAQAQAQVKQATAEVKLAKTNRDRYAKLVAEGAVNQQQFDQAQTVYDTAVATQEAQQAAVNAANEQLKAIQGALTQTQTAAFNPSIRNAQLQALIRKRDQSYAQLKSALAKVQSSQAKIKDAQAAKQQIVTQIQDAKKDLNVVSPLDGVVTARSVELGAVVDSQTKILKVVDPGTVYLRGFIPVGDIGKVRLGQVANIFLDSAPNNPLKGKVIAIDPQASFTPENIYFQKDRVKQVVGIRISVENPTGCFNPAQPYAGTDLPCAKIGMPGDAEIKLQAQKS